MIMKVLILSCLVGLAFGFEDKTVTQYLVDNGFTTLVGALQTTGLASTLDGSGPYTFYAPTNAAFAGFNLSAYTREQLTTILKYHVINEFVLVPMIGQATNRTTLEGQSITIAPSGGSLLINGNARVDSSNNDIIVNNGVVQPIDKLLSPPAFVNANIYQVLLQDDSKFKDLSLALLLSDLVSSLQGSEFTLFAPIDAAFEYYKDNLLDPAAPNAQRISQGEPHLGLIGRVVDQILHQNYLFDIYLTGNCSPEVFKYHFVPGARLSNQLQNGQTLYTLHGTPVSVTVGSGVMINNATVVQADIRASNGVIHAIDKILIPQDIDQIAAGRK